jgi:hypothetical protein
MGATTPSTTTFISRGRLSGVIRERLPRRGSTGAQRTLEARTARQERDIQAFDEALYYRARLILGDTLPRPLR